MTHSPSRISATKALSAKEIFEISQEISRKFSPVDSVKSSGFAKRIALTSKELFEISEEITRKYTPKITSSSPSLVLLPIDPEHLYVSWNVSHTQIASASKGDTQDIVLRIYPKPDETAKTTTKAWFDVALDQAKTRQKVLVPKEHIATTFTAAIGKLDQDDRFTAFATSKAVNTPRNNITTFPPEDSEMLSTKMPQAFSSNQERLQNKNNNASGQSVK
jgi:hypothetical protein